MPPQETEETGKIDKPTPFTVFFLSTVIGAAVLIPFFTGLMYLLKIHEYFDGQGLEFTVFVGLIVGAVSCAVFGGVFGYFANKQIIDMKE